MESRGPNSKLRALGERLQIDLLNANDEICDTTILKDPIYNNTSGIPHMVFYESLGQLVRISPQDKAVMTGLLDPDHKGVIEALTFLKELNRLKHNTVVVEVQHLGRAKLERKLLLESMKAAGDKAFGTGSPPKVRGAAKDESLFSSAWGLATSITGRIFDWTATPEDGKKDASERVLDCRSSVDESPNSVTRRSPEHNNSLPFRHSTLKTRLTNSESPVNDKSPSNIYEHAKSLQHSSISSSPLSSPTAIKCKLMNVGTATQICMIFHYDEILALPILNVDNLRPYSVLHSGVLARDFWIAISSVVASKRAFSHEEINNLNAQLDPERTGFIVPLHYLQELLLLKNSLSPVPKTSPQRKYARDYFLS